VTAWSPSQYLKFEDERTRPARDLLTAVPLTVARSIVDIGCGPGNSTELLAGRYPDAEIVGFDTSAEMLAAARQRLPQAKFVEADVATWMPSDRVDLMYANAVFQWVPDHLAVLARLMEALTPGGALAIQMPDNFAEPSHFLMREVAKAGPWARKLAEAEGEREEIPAAEVYYDQLKPGAVRVDIWRTVYEHALTDAAAIVAWFKSTGLRPYLNRLDPHEQGQYLAAYQARIAEAYPPRSDGRVLLHFPSIFVVAVRD
jgi:trans-aconitate 2-methyltransferase